MAPTLDVLVLFNLYLNQQVFGVDSWNQINTEGVARHTVPTIPNSKLNEKLLSIISTIRSQRKKYLKVSQSTTPLSFSISTWGQFEIS